jgi:hypothetical protein
MPEFESRTAQLRRERSSMGDPPDAVVLRDELQASEHALPLCATGFGKCVPGIGRPPELFPFFKGYRGAPISLDNVLGNLLGRRQDRFTADHSDTTDEGIRCNERRLRGEVVESSIKRFPIKVCDFLEKFGVKLFAIRYILHHHVTTRNVALVEERRCESA